MVTMQGFNPRPREGATKKILEALNCENVSIHAPVKGRPPLILLLAGNAMFQSTPP